MRFQIVDTKIAYLKFGKVWEFQNLTDAKGVVEITELNYHISENKYSTLASKYKSNLT